MTKAKVPSRPVRVLIVDDEKDLVEMLAFRLKALGGFVVKTAFDGDGVMETVLDFKPDILLLDLLLPSLDGWEVCRMLREDPETKALPIIMMTAVRSPLAEKQAAAVGVTKVVFKPFDDKKLVDLLRELLPAEKR